MSAMDELVWNISKATTPVFDSLSKAKGALEQPEKVSPVMEKYLPEFTAMAEAVIAAVADGFQFSDLSLFGKLVSRVMEIAEDIEGATGEEKKAFVVDVIWMLYHEIDTGPDGSNNRIKVPGINWLSYIGISSTEEKVERYILGIATKLAIETVYPYFKKTSPMEDSDNQ